MYHVMEPSCWSILYKRHCTLNRQLQATYLCSVRPVPLRRVSECFKFDGQNKMREEQSGISLSS